MAHAPESGSKTLVLVGPEGKFYAIPVAELENFSHPLDGEKQKDFDRLLSESVRGGRVAHGFYFDRVVARDSASFKP